MLLDIKLLLVTDGDLLILSRLAAVKNGKSELWHGAEGESILRRLARGPANHAVACPSARRHKVIYMDGCTSLLRYLHTLEDGKL